MMANFVLEFLFCKLVVYRGSEDTIVKNEEQAHTAESAEKPGATE